MVSTTVSTVSPTTPYMMTSDRTQNWLYKFLTAACVHPCDFTHLWTCVGNDVCHCMGGLGYLSISILGETHSAPESENLEMRVGLDNLAHISNHPPIKKLETLSKSVLQNYETEICNVAANVRSPSQSKVVASRSAPSPNPKLFSTPVQECYQQHWTGERGQALRSTLERGAG